MPLINLSNINIFSSENFFGNAGYLGQRGLEASMLTIVLCCPPTGRELKKTMKKVQATNLDKGNSDNGNYWMLTRWSRKSIVDTKLFNLVVENSFT